MAAAKAAKIKLLSAVRGMPESWDIDQSDNGRPYRTDKAGRSAVTAFKPAKFMRQLPQQEIHS